MNKFPRFNIKASKLTPTKVFELREKYAAGASQGSLAREYQISVGQVGRIVRGESWQQYSNPAEETPIQIMSPNLEPTPEEIQASYERLQKLLQKDVNTKVKSDLDEFLTDPKESKDG